MQLIAINHLTALLKIILLMSLSSGLMMHEHPVAYSFRSLQLTGNNTANVAKTVD